MLIVILFPCVGGRRGCSSHQTEQQRVGSSHHHLEIHA